MFNNLMVILLTTGRVLQVNPKRNFISYRGLIRREYSRDLRSPVSYSYDMADRIYLNVFRKRVVGRGKRRTRAILVTTDEDLRRVVLNLTIVTKRINRDAILIMSGILLTLVRRHDTYMTTDKNMTRIHDLRRRFRTLLNNVLIERRLRYFYMRLAKVQDAIRGRHIKSSKRP